jgi:hypothetical protein
MRRRRGAEAPASDHVAPRILFNALPRAVVRPLVAAMAAAAVSACTALGPSVVQRDQPHYADALSEASKQQLLLNIVKLRYLDAPALISVSQIVAGYSRSGSVTLGSQVLSDNLNLADDIAVGGSASFLESPTATYVPIKGADYARVLLTPVSPSDLFALVDGGAPAEVALTLALGTINGLVNRQVGANNAVRDVEPEFSEAMGLLAGLIAEREIGFRFDPGGEGLRSVTLLIRDDPTSATVPRIQRLLKLLRLKPESRVVPVRYGFGRGAGEEIVVDTRSFLQILSNLSADVQPPEGHIEAGLTVAVDTAPTIGSIRILSSFRPLVPPSESYVSAAYRGNWFWIAEDDLRSKRVFSVLLMLLSLFERTGPAATPVIAIPTR